jgi:hypothetical protein
VMMVCTGLVGLCVLLGGHAGHRSHVHDAGGRASGAVRGFSVSCLRAPSV